MVKNDYKRSLILLRSSAPGYSGHVRLEYRTQTGSMVFVLQTPKEDQLLHAALIGRDKRGYYACPIGDVRRDLRGSMSLNAAFDPRNLCGRELNRYRLVTVVRVGEEGCEIVLIGNIAGHTDMDIQEALGAVCALYGAADRARIAEEIPAEDASPEEIAIEVSPIPETEPAVPEEAPKETPDSPGTAIELLGLSADARIPPCAAAVIGMFENQPAETDVPDDEYVYVAVEGCAPCLIGLRAENGEIVSVAYAVRGEYASDPPEGLEEFSWRGDDNRGWWVLKTDTDGVQIAESEA